MPRRPRKNSPYWRGAPARAIPCAMIIRQALAIDLRALPRPVPSRPKTASGGLRPVRHHRLSRWPSQATDASGKIASGYDRMRRRSHLPEKEKDDIVVTAQKYGKKALDCAASHYGLNLGVAGAGAGLAAAGANVIETRGKFAGPTPGTSWAGRAANAIYGNAKMAFRLPTFTGFPGIGNGPRVSSTLSAAKFAGRAVPVVGYALAIGYCAVSGGE